MAKGRNNAMVATVVLPVGLLALQCAMVQAAVFVVGGTSGWAYGVETWPYDKIFKSGDILVFNYAPSETNVVSVNKIDYDRCDPSYVSVEYETGKDMIELKKGPNYFISGYQGQCTSGLKLEVYAQ